MKGDKRPHISFTSHVGIGSSEHDLHGATPISSTTSSAVTVDQLLSVLVSRQRMSYDGIVAVEARMVSTLSVKHVAKLSAVCSSGTSEVWSPRTMLMLMLINSIYPRANLVTKVTTAVP